MDSTVSMAAIVKTVAGLLAALGLAGGVAFTMNADGGGDNRNVSSVASKRSGDVSCLIAPKEGAPQQAEQQAPNVQTVANSTPAASPSPSPAPAPRSVDGNCPQGGSAPAPARDPVASGVPLFELISNSGQGRLYTTSPEEYKSAVEVHRLQQVPVAEAAVALVSPTTFDGATAIHRLRNDTLNTWLFTIDANSGGEKEKLLAGTLAGPGWKDEGVSGYIHSENKPGTVPLLRFHRNGVNEWRLGVESRKAAIEGQGYTWDGPKPMGYVTPAPADTKPPAVTPPAAAPEPLPPAWKAGDKPTAENKAARKAACEAGIAQGKNWKWLDGDRGGIGRCDDLGPKSGPKPGKPAPRPSGPAPAPEPTKPLIPNNAMTYECGTSLEYCSHERGVYARSYNTSDIVHRPPGATCPGGCGEGYYFRYWPR